MGGCLGANMATVFGEHNIEHMASAEASGDEVPAELEHIIGFSSKFSNTCLAHPVDQDKVIYNMASLVVISDLSDPYVFLCVWIHVVCVCSVLP